MPYRNKIRRGSYLAYWEGGDNGHWVICNADGNIIESADDCELDQVLRELEAGN